MGNVGNKIRVMQSASAMGNGLLELVGRVATRDRAWVGSTGKGDRAIFKEGGGNAT
jgi:hypothetical protein